MDNEALAECEMGFIGFFELDAVGDALSEEVPIYGEVLVCAMGFGGFSEGGGRVVGLRVGGGRGMGCSAASGCRNAEPLAG